jgi:hypothetical protein
MTNQQILKAIGVVKTPIRKKQTAITSQHGTETYCLNGC